MRTGRLGWLALAAGLVCRAWAAESAPPATADDDLPPPQQVVVTATRIETPVNELPDSVTVVTVETMDLRQYRTVNDALQSVPGVSFRATGGTGSQTSVFTRGLDAGRTLFMVDGMPMNDPSAIRGAFDPGALTLDNINQLEVLAGPQSASRGASAMGGVVNLASKKGEGPLSGFVSAEGGSRGTVVTRAGAQAGGDKADFSFAGSYARTDGVSAIDKKYGNTERDHFEQGSAALRLGADPVDNLRLDLFVHAQKAEVEMDYAPGKLYDNPDLMQRTERFMIRPQATLSLFDDRWVQTAGFGYSYIERKYRDAPAYEGNDYWPQRNRYMGETLFTNYQSLFQLHETNTLVAGVDVKTERTATQNPYYGGYKGPVDSFGSLTTVGVFVEDRVRLGDVFVADVGVRNDHHDLFGNHVTWRAGAAYTLPTATRLKASVGTGFRAPTLDELHGDGGLYTRPNRDLDPERSVGWEAGFDQSLLCDSLTFGGTFFKNRVKNMIVWEGGATWYDPGVNRNVGRAETWGIEAFAQWRITDTLTLSGQYTWLRAWDVDKREELQHRPLNEGSLDLDWRFRGKGTLTAGAHYVGRRYDSNYYIDGGARKRMGSYMTARLGASWKVSDHIEVFGRVENLFDRDYQDILGYGTEGIGFFGGATLRF